MRRRTGRTGPRPRREAARTSKQSQPCPAHFAPIPSTTLSRGGERERERVGGTPRRAVAAAAPQKLPSPFPPAKSKETNGKQRLPRAPPPRSTPARVARTARPSSSPSSSTSPNPVQTLLRQAPTGSGAARREESLFPRGSRCSRAGRRCTRWRRRRRRIRWSSPRGCS